MIAEDAVFADHGVGVGEEVAASLNAGIEDDVGKKRGVGTKTDAGANDGVSADVRVRADFGRGIDDCGGMDAGRVGRRLIEETERARKGVIGVLDAEGSRGDLLKFGFDDDSGGSCGAGERGIAGICDEGDLSRTGFLKAFDAGNFQVRVAAEFRA
jgi:hypothetical protein